MKKQSNPLPPDVTRPTPPPAPPKVDIDHLRNRIEELEHALYKYINAGCGNGTHRVNQKAALDNAIKVLLPF